VRLGRRRVLSGLSRWAGRMKGIEQDASISRRSCWVRRKRKSTGVQAEVESGVKTSKSSAEMRPRARGSQTVTSLGELCKDYIKEEKTVVSQQAAEKRKKGKRSCSKRC